MNANKHNLRCGCGSTDFEFIGVQNIPSIQIKTKFIALDLFNCLNCGTTKSVRVYKKCSCGKSVYMNQRKYCSKECYEPAMKKSWQNKANVSYAQHVSKQVDKQKSDTTCQSPV
jgi:hypothetical protein